MRFLWGFLIFVFQDFSRLFGPFTIAYPSSGSASPAPDLFMAALGNPQVTSCPPQNLVFIFIRVTSCVLIDVRPGCWISTGLMVCC